MKVATFFMNVLAFGLFGLGSAVPLGAQYLYASGPDWMRAGDGLGLALSATFAAILLFVCGLFSVRTCD